MSDAMIDELDTSSNYLGRKLNGGNDTPEDHARVYDARKVLRSRIAELEAAIAVLNEKIEYLVDDRLPLANENISAKVRIAKLEAEQHWITVNNQLPIFRDRVLVMMKNNYRMIATFYDDHWTIDGGMRVELKDVTHWMPLPKPPL